MSEKSRADSLSPYPLNTASSCASKAAGHIERGEYHQAISLLESALAQGIESQQIIAQLICCYRNLGYHDEIDTLIAHSVNQSDPTADIHHEHGLSLMGKAEFTKGIEQFMAAIALMPQRLESWFAMSSCYFELGELDQAETAISHIEKTHTEAKILSLQLGKIMLSKGRIRDARRIYCQRIKPRFAEYSDYNQACILTVFDYQPQKALTALERQFKYHPECKAWARHDSDLLALKHLTQFKVLINR